MEQETGKQRIGYIKKYQYVLLIALAGVFLMLMPQRAEKPQAPAVTEEIQEMDLERKLSAILGTISGVGKTEVLLTEASGSDTIYQMDTGNHQSDLDTVIVMGGNREEAGLVKQVLPPVYRGAVIVCQGADSASVRLNVVEAVKSATGLSSDCITVLKMK